MSKVSHAQTNRRGIMVDGASRSKLPAFDSNVRFTDFLRMNGAEDGVFAIGDCTATSYAPTAQVASQQGAYLARLFNQLGKRDNLQNRLNELEVEEARVTNEEDKARVAEEVASVRKHLSKIKLRPFHYSHQGSLA